jgi:hypothetical protein
LDDIAKGFRLVIEGKESIKVIIKPNEGIKTLEASEKAE